MKIGQRELEELVCGSFSRTRAAVSTTLLSHFQMDEQHLAVMWGFHHFNGTQRKTLEFSPPKD